MATYSQKILEDVAKQYGIKPEELIGAAPKISDLSKTLAQQLANSPVNKAPAGFNYKTFTDAGKTYNWGGGGLYGQDWSKVADVPESNDFTSILNAISGALGYAPNIDYATKIMNAQQYLPGYAKTQGEIAAQSTGGASGKSYVNASGQTVIPKTAQEEQNMISLGFTQPVPKTYASVGATGENGMTDEELGVQLSKLLAGTAQNQGLQSGISGTIGDSSGGIAGGGGGVGGTIGGDNTQMTINAILSALGESSASDADFRTQMTNMLAKLQEQQGVYTTALTNLPTAEATYSKYREQLGLPAQEAEYTAASKQVMETQQKVADVETLIDKLESDITSRVQGMSGVQLTEAQRRRVLATEQKPLTQQLSDLSTLLGRQSTVAGKEQLDVTSAQSQLQNLLSMAQQTQEQQIAAAKAPLEYTQSLLPTLSELAQYQSPQEKLAAQLAQEQAYKAAGLGSYYQAPKTTTGVTLSPGETYFDPATGKAIYTAPTKEGTPDSSVDTSDVAITEWIKANKSANPSIAYYDLWGQLADTLKEKGLNPADYDKLFWIYLHPEGEAGYNKYILGQK